MDRALVSLLGELNQYHDNQGTPSHIKATMVGGVLLMYGILFNTEKSAKRW